MKATEEPIETDGPSWQTIRRARVALMPFQEQLDKLRRQEEALMEQPSEDLQAHYTAWLAIRERVQRLELHATFLQRYIEGLTAMAEVGR